MALGSQLPIRLDPDTEKRIEAAAEQAGTTKSAMIRMLAKTFVDQCVQAGGKVTLPPNWHDLLPGRDGRSTVITANQSGTGNKQTVFKSASAPAQEPVKKPKGKRGKKKPPEK